MFFPSMRHLGRFPGECAPLWLALLVAIPCPAMAQAVASGEDVEDGRPRELRPIEVREGRETDLRSEGTAAQGYRSSTASRVGPMADKALQDLPYAIQVMPQALIENVQATKPDDVLKLSPVLQLTTPQSRFFTGATLRGFSVGSNKRVDGMPNANMVSVDIEDKERVEVLTGLSGFLYGPGNVGGTLNYVLKRPTYERYNSITTGLAEGRNGYVHGDFGGPIDAEGRLAYRLNLLGQDGDTATDHQSLHRSLVSGALDWNLSNRLQLQFDASRSNYRMRGTEPYWSAVSGVKYPSASRATDAYYGQPYTSTETQQAHAGARLRWQLSDDLTLRAGMARRTSESDLVVVNNTFTAGTSGSYRVQSSAWEYPDFTNRATYAFADWKFATGGVRHLVTAGFSGDVVESTNYRSSAGGWQTATSATFNIDQPVYIDSAVTAPTGPKYRAQRNINRNLVLADDIRFGPQWSALVGLNRATLVANSYGATGASTAAYDQSRTSPSVSLIYKPVPALSVYTNYMESLEQGGTASATYNSRVVSNAGVVMAPLVSKQVEIGAKLEGGGVLWTAALFQIDKGLEYYDTAGTGPVTYVQDGRQVHKGLEFTATGRLARQLSVVGGVTLLDAQVTRNTQTPALVGKTPANVAERLAKVYLEYDLDAVPGLTLTGGVFYTGRQFVDAANTDVLPSYVTADLGVRYATRVGAMPLTLRLNVSNLTDKRYWMNSNYLGAGRTLALSAQLKF